MVATQPFDVARFRESASAAARLLKALANERRLLVLCQLNEGERSVGALAEAVGLEQSALSQHLARLREEGIVATRREAQTVFYRLANQEVVVVMRTLAEIFCPDGTPSTNAEHAT